MRPGISIQHTSLPSRTSGVVRCDIAAMIAFIPQDRWPEGASSGDFVELIARRLSDLQDHPLAYLYDPVTTRSVRCFFENGGDTVHLFAVCIDHLDDLKAPSSSDGPLLPLFDRLRTEEDIALVAVPSAALMRCEITRSGLVYSEADALYRLLLAHCREMVNRFLVIDAPRGLHAELLERWLSQLRGKDPHTDGFGAVYYPWLQRGDDLFPPSGAILGLYARVEREHAPSGVGWPPANLPLWGTTHTEVDLSWDEAGRVQDAGINPILVQPGRGVIVWGARTLSTDPRWTFVNSRRIVSMITEQLRRDNEWVVFETNNRSLWKIIERDVIVRLDQFWQAGILAGTRSQEEYSVECSESTNPLALRDAGQLNVQVALKPVGTTERILIDLRLGSSES